MNCVNRKPFQKRRIANSCRTLKLHVHVILVGPLLWATQRLEGRNLTGLGFIYGLRLGSDGMDMVRG